MSTPTKECPFCSEEIKATAKKCRYCGEFLDGSTREQVWNEVNTGGGASIGNDVTTGRDFIGRDQFNADTITLGKSQRDEQYEIVLHWDRERLLREFDLSGRDLSNLDLEGADLRGSNLSGADLSNANLSNAELSGANLSNAELSGADLSNVELSGADLRGADLFVANLTNAKYQTSTQWPEGFNTKKAGAKWTGGRVG